MFTEFHYKRNPYGPDTVGHIRNLSPLSKSEMQIGIFTFNRRIEQGHRTAQDQALEANFNKDIKNHFRVRTVKNIIKRAACCQRK